MSHDLFPVNETPKKQVHVESSSPAVTINPFIEGQADHGAYGSLKSESNKGYNCLSTNLDESYLTALCKLLHNENEYELLVFDRKENKLVLREDKKQPILEEEVPEPSDHLFFQDSKLTLVVGKNSKENKLYGAIYSVISQDPKKSTISVQFDIPNNWGSQAKIQSNLVTK